MIDSPHCEDVRVFSDYSCAIYKTFFALKRHYNRLMVLQSQVHAARSTVTVAEAADYLSSGKPKMYELIRTGEVQALRIGRRLLIP